MGLVGRTTVIVCGPGGVSEHKLLEDLRPGHKVWSLAGDGTLATGVIEAVSDKMRPVYEVELDDGLLVVRSDLDQRFLEYVYHASRLSWTKLQKLYVGCYLVAKKPSTVVVNRPFNKPYEKYFPDTVYPAKITHLRPAGIGAVRAVKIGQTHNFFGNDAVCHA